MHFISFAQPRPPIENVEVGMYRKIAGAVTSKTFGIAGLPPELDELSFRRDPPRKCAHRRGGGGISPALDKAAFCPGSGTIRPGAPSELRVSSCTCSIPIAASTAIRAASFA
jgi:hypothetical protein